MRNSDYWKKRFEQLEQLSNDEATKYYKEAEKSLNRAIATIETDIEKWYNRLALNNDVSLLRAKELLNSKELKEFKWTVEEYIKYGEKNAITQEWAKELENASAKVHIERLEAIKLQMQNQIEVAYGNLEDGLSTMLGEIYKNTYYHAGYEIQKCFNVGSSMAQIDDNKVQKTIRKPWGADKNNFSSRLWSNKQKLINTLNTNLTQSIIRGEDPSKAINQISKVMGTAKSNVGRLVMTESAFIASAAQKDCFTQLGLKQYEIVATLDTKTSEICRELDGKVFDMKDYQTGVTAPPFHPYCRTTTCPYFNDEFTQGEERAYRDAEGKTQYARDMKYDEWYEKYVANDEKYREKRIEWQNKNKILVNEHKDILRENYEAYRTRGVKIKPKDNVVNHNKDDIINSKIIEFKKRLENGEVNTKIKWNKQKEHVLGTKEWKKRVQDDIRLGKTPASLFLKEIDYNDLIASNLGKGKIVFTNDKNLYPKEYIQYDEVIGRVFNVGTGRYEVTRRFAIHYSNKGIHAHPVKEKE